MARKSKFSDEFLQKLREMPLTMVFDGLGLYWKTDREYKPIRDKSSIRVNVSLSDGRICELLITGIRWYDTRTKLGGGGAIDLVMYLYSVTFKEAIGLLSKVPGTAKSSQDARINE